LKLHDHFEDDANIYLLLQYCSKGQLYELLKKQHGIGENFAAQYIRETISAVEYLHSQDRPIIHRDIKPENILLDEQGVIKLADFGWANFLPKNGKRASYCGTPEYLSPEMIQKQGHDVAVDVWSIGVLLYELLAGDAPFSGKTQGAMF